MAPNTGTDIQVDKELPVNEVNHGEVRVSSKFIEYSGTVEKDSDLEVKQRDESREGSENVGQELVWSNIVQLALLHLGTLYSLYAFSWTQNWKTTAFMIAVMFFSGFGVTGGVHRLWTHRAYKAKWPLRLILAVSYCTAGMNSIFDWVRDHRVHHKYSETDADPHNAKRGFFFAHVGWLMMRKHPEVIRKGQMIDMSDITGDPIARFFDSNFAFWRLFFTIVLPVLIPVYGWNETWGRAIMSQVFLRYVLGLNAVWSVNSAAHLWGSRPYDKNISPAENTSVCVWALGEGFHNYHHVFPSDYKAAELPIYGLNLTTLFIDTFAKIGWAYDLKEPSRELVNTTIQNRGDGSHPVSREALESKNK